MTTPENLAVTFRHLIRRDIPAEELAHIDRVNADLGFGCATHEYLDANETMLEAWEETFDGEFNCTQDEMDIMNTAWGIAIKRGYSGES